MRLLLIKQDEISILEKQLDRTDVKESKELFLGNCRRDGNSERKQIVRRLETCLAEYGKFYVYKRIYPLTLANDDR